MDPILIVLILSVAAFIVGLVLDAEYHKNYHATSVNEGTMVVQSIFVALFALTFPTNDVTIWFVLSIIGVTTSYTVGLTLCWKDAKSIHADRKHMIMEMAAQALMPLGFALLIIIVLQMILGSKNGNRKKRK